jgi:hypothetical protein
MQLTVSILKDLQLKELSHEAIAHKNAVTLDEVDKLAKAFE